MKYFSEMRNCLVFHFETIWKANEGQHRLHAVTAVILEASCRLQMMCREVQDNSWCRLMAEAVVVEGAGEDHRRKTEAPLLFLSSFQNRWFLMCWAEVSVNSVGSLLVAAGQWQQRDLGVWATVQFAFFRLSANRRMAACRYCCSATQTRPCQRRHPLRRVAASVDYRTDPGQSWNPKCLVSLQHVPIQS